MTIPNLIGLSNTFEYALKFDAAENVTLLAHRFVHADMGAAALQRHMPQAYHDTVNAAKRWLREADEVIAGDRERTHDAALECRKAWRRQASQLRAIFTATPTVPLTRSCETGETRA